MLRSVRIKNFKSFSDSVFKLSPLTLVLGSNGAGKSNFFDALRFLRFVGDGTSIRDAIEGHAAATPAGDASLPAIISGIRGGASELAHIGSDSPVFEIEIDLELFDDRITYWIAVDSSTYRVVGEELASESHRGGYVFSTRPDGIPLAQRSDAPVISARFYKRTPGQNPRREFSPHSSILSQFQGRLAESNVNEAVAEMARNELHSIRPIELRPEVLRQYSPLGIVELGEHGENFPAVVWLLKGAAQDNDVARDRLSAIESWLEELTPHAIQEVMTVNAPTGEVLFAVREVPFDLVTARSLSDGTLRFAALAFAVLGPIERRTLLIEELENGIHPRRLELLIRMLEASVVGDWPAQVIASTHSPQILDFAAPSTLNGAIVIGWDSERQCSHVNRLGDLPDFDDLVQRVSPGDLQAEGWLDFAAER